MVVFKEVKFAQRFMLCMVCESSFVMVLYLNILAIILSFYGLRAYGDRNAMLEEKVKALQDWIYKKPVVVLNMDRWTNFVQTASRNYSMVVMFTATSSDIDCNICKAGYDEFYIVANSYRYAYTDSKALYFGLVDYAEVPEIFMQMKLQTVPAIIHFPPKGSRKKADEMDLKRTDFGAESIAKFIKDRTDIQIHILQPPNYAAPAVILLLAMLVLGLLYMRRDNLEFLYNRTGWALISLCIVFVFMSGQMWNHIRGPPFLISNPHSKETSFIYRSTQYQLVAETYIVAVLYAAISAGFIVLNDAADGKGDMSRRRILVFVGLGLIALFFSLLLSIFRSKYRGYPYSFLFQ